MSDAFISYRRQPSAALAHLLQEKLKNHHSINAYVDTTRTDSTKVQFPERLMQAIADAPVFVCLLGDITLESEWVMKEIDEAHRLQKRCLPVFQESYRPMANPPASVEYLLSFDGVHVMDVKSIFIDESVEKLAALVKPKQNRVRPLIAIGVLAVLLIAVVFTNNFLNPKSNTAEPTTEVALVSSDTPELTSEITELSMNSDDARSTGVANALATLTALAPTDTPTITPTPTDTPISASDIQNTAMAETFGEATNTALTQTAIAQVTQNAVLTQQFVAGATATYIVQLSLTPLAINTPTLAESTNTPTLSQIMSTSTPTSIDLQTSLPNANTQLAVTLTNEAPTEALYPTAYNTITKDNAENVQIGLAFYQTNQYNFPLCLVSPDSTIMKIDNNLYSLLTGDIVLSIPQDSTLSYSPDGTHLIVTSYDSIYLYDALDFRLIYQIENLRGERGVVFNSTGQVFRLGDAVFETETGNLLYSSWGDFSSDGLLITSGEGVLNSLTGDIIQPSIGYGRFLPNNTMVISGNAVYEISTGEQLFSIDVPSNALTASTISPNGNYIAIEDHGVYSLTNGEFLFFIGGMFSLRFSPDSRYIAVDTDGVYELTTGRKVSNLSSSGEFSPDGSYLMVYQVGVFRTSDWQRIFPIRSGGDFNSDSSLFVSTDGIYDTLTGEQLLIMSFESPVFTDNDSLIVDIRRYQQPYSNPYSPCQIFGLNDNPWPFRVGLIQISSAANVRSAPEQQASIVSSIAGQLAVYGVTEDRAWYLIGEQDEQQFWVSASVATVLFIPDNLPVVDSN